MQLGPINLSRRSISFRLAILFCISFSVALIAAFAISLYEMRSLLEESDKEVISSKFKEVETLVTAGDIKNLEDFFTLSENQIKNAPYLIRILSESGAVLYFKPSIQEKVFDLEGYLKETGNPSHLVGWHELAAIDDEDIFYTLTGKIHQKYYLQIGKSNENYEAILGGMLSVFGVTAIVFIILSAGLGLLYARKTLKPLRQLVSTINTIESGDLSQRVPVTESKDELNDLGQTFNRMVTRIEKLIKVMEESLDNVAHEIRTPLTKIKAVAEDALLSNNPTPLKEALEDCAENATEVAGLVEQLLSISEAEAGTLVLNRSTCRVKDLLDSIVDIYEFVAQEKDISIACHCDSELVWDLDRKRVKQAVGNLLDNAIKFSPSGASVELGAVVNEAGALLISVRDHGFGIAPSDLNRIWERLFRADKARSTKGSGLGLSIVRSVAISHGGVAQAVINPDSGMTFMIIFPKAPQK